MRCAIAVALLLALAVPVAAQERDETTAWVQYAAEKKEPVVAFLVEALVPLGGFIYAGDVPWWSVAATGTTAVGVWLVRDANDYCEPTPEYDFGRVFYVTPRDCAERREFAWLVVGLGRVVGLIGAPALVSTNNAELKRRLRLSVAPAPGGLELALRVPAGGR